MKRRQQLLHTVSFWILSLLLYGCQISTGNKSRSLAAQEAQGLIHTGRHRIQQQWLSWRHRLRRALQKQQGRNNASRLQGYLAFPVRAKLNQGAIISALA